MRHHSDGNYCARDLSSIDHLCYLYVILSTVQLRSIDDLEIGELISQLWHNRFLYFSVLSDSSALELADRTKNEANPSGQSGDISPLGKRPLILVTSILIWSDLNLNFKVGVSTNRFDSASILTCNGQIMMMPYLDQYPIFWDATNTEHHYLTR